MGRSGPIFCAVLVVGGVIALGPPNLPGLPDIDLPDLRSAGADSRGGGGDCPRQVEPWSRVQTGHAGTIVRVGHEMDIPRRGRVIALATAMQESSIRNLANSSVPASLRRDNDGVGHDHDSVGIFQQRPGWGSVRERMDPEYAAEAFYRALCRVRGWQNMRVTEAAQRVQRSAFPEAYQQHADEAEDLAHALRHCR